MNRLFFALIILFAAQTGLAQVLPEVREQTCVYGDCENGLGTLELKVEFGTALYRGSFRNGKFHGNGRLETPVSFTQRALYNGNWEDGVRSGRGTYFDGRGDLYIGQWRNDRRHGQGSYFFGLEDWRENEHTEFWLSQNSENYTGEFVNDLYQGRGVYRWKNGSRFEGGFFASEKHGFGTYYYSTGTARQ
ncbi:MAG: hypothetical protein WD772_10155, partial [Pseudohongiellaceae bacterium]